MAEVANGQGSSKTTKFVILDGFMLYVNEQLRNTIDVRFFLTAPYQVLKERRESRKGYATLEGNALGLYLLNNSLPAFHDQSLSKHLPCVITDVPDRILGGPSRIL